MKKEIPKCFILLIAHTVLHFTSIGYGIFFSDAKISEHQKDKIISSFYLFCQLYAFSCQNYIVVIDALDISFLFKLMYSNTYCWF